MRESTLRIMARIDALYLEDPCSGSRLLVDYLAREGIPISRDRVRRLMRRMGSRAIYQKPRATVPGDRSERFPCLIDLKQVTALDQVWATDITYIPLQKGFLYLVAIMDLHSTHVYSFGEGFAYSWRLSNSLDTEFCLDALEMALDGGRKPEIFHSDQGCQFTSGDFVARLKAEEIKVTWSGRRRCYDNILVEKLLRTLNYVAASFSAKPSRGLSACLQRWLGGGNQPDQVPVEVLPCKATQFFGRKNPPYGLH
ncbi:MAG: DDE-type integrase/transposase/recombinase [Prochlorococcaceae cyanobacterium]